MRERFIQLVLATSLVVAVSPDADAKPRRVVVLDFDGPRQLADTGRSTVMGVLGEQYNIVATKNWDSARARASGRGPQQWRQASKQAGVDAVIEGWVQQEGRHHVLTIAVKDASNGHEIDTLSIRIKERGLTSETTHKLAAQLDDLLAWIDGDVTAEPSQTLPDVRTMRPMRGAKRSETIDAESEKDEISIDDEEAEEADDDIEERPARKQKKRKTKKVAAAIDPEADDTTDLVTLFGPDSTEAAIVTDGKSVHTPVPTPRFQISAGPFVGARGITFEYDTPDDSSGPPEYPGSVVKGFGAHVAVFPMPKQKRDGKVQGVGFSLDIAKSVGSVLTIENKATNEFRDCTVDHTAWDLGAHYRWPIDFVAVGISGNFGKNSHAIVDVPEDLGFPDTDFTYVGGGANVELAVTERATVGFNARFQYLLGSGNITEEAAYGWATGYGMALGGDFVVPLPGAMFVRGVVNYQRFKIDFQGTGELTKQWGVWDATDAAITGSANLGVAF